MAINHQRTDNLSKMHRKQQSTDTYSSGARQSPTVWAL